MPVELLWTENRPDRGEAKSRYEGFDGATCVGSVALNAGTHEQIWLWAGAWGGDGNRGYCHSRRDAMLALETALNAYLSKYPNARSMVPYG